MNLAKSTLKVFVARFSGSVIAFLGTVYFARVLGASLFGTFVLFQALSGMLAIPADFGLQGAVTKRMSEQENLSEILSTTVLMLTFSLTLVCAIVFVFQDAINSYIGARLAIFLVISIILNEFAKLAENVLRGELRVGETALLSFTKQIIFNVLGVVFVFTGAGVIGLVYALLTSTVIVIFFGFYKWDTSFGNPSFEAARSLFNYSKFSIVSHIDSYLYNWLDVAVIGLLLVQSKVGAYEAAWRISVIVILFTSAIETTILPQISEWDSGNSHTQIENIIPNAILASLFFVIPAFFGVLVLSREILYYVFTPEYAIAWPILIILLGGKLFEGIDRIFWNVLSGMDRPDLRAIAVLVSISFNIVLNFVLVNYVGLIGAAIATTISFGLSTLITTYFLNNLITIRFPYREVLCCTIGASVMGFILFITQKYITITSLPLLAIFILIGGAIYFSTIVFFPSIRYRLRDVLRSLSS